MILQIESHVGEPITSGEFKIIPLARSFRIHLPGIPGGLIWNRPVAIITQKPDGLEEVLPIRDITRQVQLGIIGIMTGVLLIFWVLRLKRKPNVHKEMIL